jgi:two-component system, NtrC family, sensor kinase
LSSNSPRRIAKRRRMMTKILIIDDEESIRNMMRMSLEMDNYEVLTAEDGSTGMDVFKAETPDVVLLDIRMPGMDGLEVLERIKSGQPDTEVIVITGHGDMSMVVDALRKEASNFIAKPVSDDLLSLSIKQCLEKQTLKRKVKQYTQNLETLVREANLELEMAYKFRENLIEYSPDAIVSIRKGGEIVIFNSAAERLLGYAKDEVIGKLNIRDIYALGVAKEVMKFLVSKDFGGPGRVEKRELTVRHKDGHEIPVYLSAAILYENGKETGSVGIFTDIREKKALEEQLHLSGLELERAYQFRENLIFNSPDATVSIRKGGEIVIFNSAAEKLLGYTKDEVIGKLSIAEIYAPGVAKEVMKHLRSNAYGGPGRIEKRELTVLHKDGHEIPVYLSAAILYENDEEAGSVGIFTDLREKKELERQLLRSEKLSSLGKLAAGIAHEINQPLTGVLTFASLLLKKYRDDEATRKDLEIVVRETTRIRGIVQGVLDFARETPMHKSTVQIQTVLDRTLDIVERQERFFGLTVEKDYDQSVPHVIVDANLMEQVFMNVLLNAADAMEGSGALKLRTSSSEDWVNVEINDTGRGMPEEIVDRIFDPFFTTKDSTEGMGMGLGLAVSYGIVKNHSGEIRVESKEGKGTTFSIRLPVQTL